MARIKGHVAWPNLLARLIAIYEGTCVVAVCLIANYKRTHAPAVCKPIPALKSGIRSVIAAGHHSNLPGPESCARIAVLDVPG